MLRIGLVCNNSLGEFTSDSEANFDRCFANQYSSNHRLEQLDAHNSGFSSMPVTLSMPEIKSNAKQRKQKQKWSKAGTQKQSQTKLPKL